VGYRDSRSALDTPADVDCFLTQQLTQARYIVLILDGDTLGREFFNLLRKELQIFAGDHAENFESVRKSAHQI